MPSIVQAAFGFKLDGTFDKEAVSHAYFEGEFSRVLPPLEAFRSSFPGNATKEDSIFVYKYLSVIYASNPKNRQKAESYMVQLIKIMPTIELMDLYISDNIEAIFKNVKLSYAQQQAYVRGHDEYGRAKNPRDDSLKMAAIIKRPVIRPWFWWTLGGLGTAAFAATAYIAINSNSESKSNTINSKP